MSVRDMEYSGRGHEASYSAVNLLVRKKVLIKRDLGGRCALYPARPEDQTTDKDLHPNSFGEACFEQNTIQDLEETLRGQPDPTDIREWDISAAEYYAQAYLALCHLRAEEKGRA